LKANTGVYQLYTIVRLKSILQKIGVKTEFESLDLALLNQQEKELLLKTYQLPVTLDTVIDSFKPHHLCTYLFETAAMINKWYEGNPVASLEDEKLRENKIEFIKYLIWRQAEALNLLGIEVIDRL
jgi:arginyl-tRNA synthetase